METSELYEQIYNCRNFLNEFYKRMIEIFRFIKSKSKYQKSSSAWNRFNYYEDSLSLKKCDWINGLQVPIFEYLINKIGYRIRLEILCLIQDNSYSEKTCEGQLLFLFTCQKDNLCDWPSWINPQDNEWISKALNDTYIVPRNEDEKLGHIESFFLAHAFPLESFFSQEKINASLKKINRIILDKTKRYCGVEIDDLFNG